MKTYNLSTLKMAELQELVELRHQRSPTGFWEQLERTPLTDGERRSLEELNARLRHYRTHRVNEATIWARAIYPLLVLAEREEVGAFAQVPLSARWPDALLSGEADGVLARNMDEEPVYPYFVVVEAKRGIDGSDPVAQLYGALLCAARGNAQLQEPALATTSLLGCYTIADVWTCVQARFERLDGPRPLMTVAVSREYVERSESAAILAILKGALSAA